METMEKVIPVTLLGLIAGMGGGIAGAKASTGFAKNLREAMFRNIQTFSFANIDKFSTSGLVTRMTTDVTNVQNAYQMILRMCIRAPFSMICAMAMAFYISPRIATIYLIAVIILGIILHKYVIFTTEVDLIMFGRQIYVQSYIYSILLTIAFSILVNAFVYFQLKKIDMVESLKSTE